MKRNPQIFVLIGLTLLFYLNVQAQSVPPLINYQGRLTGQTGAPLAAGVYGIQFRLWDDPLASGTNDLIWGQLYSNIAIQSNGVFNVILGGGTPLLNPTPAVNNLAYAFNGTNCFLGVTVVASNGSPLSLPSEILPRQQLLSVPFALQSQQAQIASSVVPNSIVNASLSGGIVTLTNLAPRPIGTNVGVGGLAMSASSATNSIITNLVATIVTTGRPVFVSVVPDGSGLASALVTADAYFKIVRDQTVIAIFNIGVSEGNAMDLPPGILNTIDIPPAGSHTYSIQMQIIAADPSTGVGDSVLIAYEL